jgi:hypothetical protein
MMNFFSLFLNDSPDVIDDDTRHPACDLRHAREKRRYEVSQSVSQPFPRYVHEKTCMQQIHAPYIVSKKKFLKGFDVPLASFEFGRRGGGNWCCLRKAVHAWMFLVYPSPA